MARIPREMHSAQSVCPVCGSTKRDLIGPVKRGLPASWLSRYYKRPISDLIQPISSYRCRNCDAVYNDPYFSIEARATVFQSIHPQHGGGWFRYGFWQRNQKHSNTMQADLAVYSLAEKILGNIDVYAEVNCPFMGFLMDFSDMGSDPAAVMDLETTRHGFDTRSPLGILSLTRRRRFYKKRMSQKIWRILNDIDYRISDRANSIKIRFVLSTRNFSSKMRFMFFGSPRLNIDFKKPERKYLIRIQSSIYWGNNCTARGISCQGVSAGLLDAPVVSIEEMGESKIFCDLICLFDVLDHLSDPIGHLRKLLKLTRLVLIRSHHTDENSCQHLFGFPQNFPDYLNKIGVYAIDVTDMIGEPTAVYHFATNDQEIACNMKQQIEFIQGNTI